MSQVEARKLNQSIVKEKGFSFNQLVNTEVDKLKVDELKHLLDDIINQGERLSRHQTLRELIKYKRSVKSFIKVAVNNGLELSHDFNLNGESRHLSIVKQIDKQLLELTDTMIAEESHSIDLLDKIGEIKGLLIDLYS